MKSKEQVKLWRKPALPRLELMRATYVTQTFPPHVHEDFAIGVVEAGALGFRYRGAEVVAPAGAVNLANPGEPHTGQAAVPEGWTCRMFYLDPALLHDAARQMADGPAEFPFFQAGVIHDNALASRVRDLHRLLEGDGGGCLAVQTRFLQMLTLLIMRHADTTPRRRPAGRGTLHCAARAGLHRGPLQPIAFHRSTGGRSRLKPLSFHTGFPPRGRSAPHAYLSQLRVRKAKALLARGESVAAAALAVGFVDQSHLNRHFKRITGFTPGHYRRIVQDAV
jgi:hypothetical protein